MRRLFAAYALACLVPVVLLGTVLQVMLYRQATRQGLADGKAQAALFAGSSLEPLLRGVDLRGGLTTQEHTALERSVKLSLRNDDLLRLRVRDLDGRVVYSNDGSGGGADGGVGTVDDEVREAAAGRTIAILTRLNTDPNDHGPGGPRVVEVYEPLAAPQNGARIGVLEVYLPYAPISARIAHGARVVAYAIGGGALLLWAVLLWVSWSAVRGLRTFARQNAFLAGHDTLTGLPNRAAFAKQAAKRMATATSELPAAIALLDLDRFQQVNDTLGHRVGDELLIILADRLREHLQDGDEVVARLGGDEFGIVLPAVHGPGEVVEVLSRIRAVLAEPLRIDGLPIAVEASVGFALAPDDGPDIGAVMRRADVAMYAAKRQHLAVVHYQPEHDQHDPKALSLVAELGAAIAGNDLVLHYQPKTDVASGRVTSLEALVRWRHPTHGLLYPDAFIPAAEQTELIEDLTLWSLRTAARALPELDPSGTVTVGVNVSARSLVRPDFATDVLEIVNQTGVEPGRVILEITETALMADPPRAARTLTRLHETGVRISIDDFGAGQTSLGYLATLPINELKIDKAFVLSMLVDERNAAIVRSVIELGHSLGLHVTAEGVETDAIMERLREFRCDTAQGYLFSQPIPQQEVPGRLALIDQQAQVASS